MTPGRSFGTPGLYCVFIFLWCSEAAEGHRMREKWHLTVFNSRLICLQRQARRVIACDIRTVVVGEILFFSSSVQECFH